MDATILDPDIWICLSMVRIPFSLMSQKGAGVINLHLSIIHRVILLLIVGVLPVPKYVLFFMCDAIEKGISTIGFTGHYLVQDA